MWLNRCLLRTDGFRIPDSKGMPLASAAEIELVRSLEEGGRSRKAPEELVSALDHHHSRERRSDPWMLAYAALLTALIVGGFGWMNSRIDTMDAKIDETRDAMVQRLTAIETIINERIHSVSR